MVAVKSSFEQGGTAAAVLAPAPSVQPDETGVHEPEPSFDTIADNADHEARPTGESSDEEQDNGETKESKWSLGMKTLRRYVTAAKGAASAQVVNHIKEYLGGTKMIFVVGKTGTGKTTLLRELTELGDEDLKVGGTLRSGTLQYQLCPAIIDNEQYIFVDTPGFGAADLDDDTNFENIMTCLTALGPFVTVAGVLFVHASDSRRLFEDDVKTIRWLQCFVGAERFRHITIVTTMWDDTPQNKLQQRWSKMQEFENHQDIKMILDPPGRYHGGVIYHHGFPGGNICDGAFKNILDMDEQHLERAREIQGLITRRYAKSSSTNSKVVKLQVLRELADGKQLQDTMPAMVLRRKTSSYTLVLSRKADTTSMLLKSYDTLNSTTKSSKPENTTPSKPSPVGHKATPPQIKAKSEASQHSSEKKKVPPAPSWFESFWVWFDIAKQTAAFFREARKPRKTKPRWTVYEAVKNWWSGDMPDTP